VEERKTGVIVENEGSGEVCLEETVERLRRSGLSVEEISEKTGLDASWVGEIVARSEAAFEGNDER
jgi:predicted transposase YdaD